MSNTRSGHAVRRMSYWFLCAVPFLNAALVGVRALRVPIIHQVIGIVVFAVIALAMWTLGARAVKSTAEHGRMQAIAGGLLMTPSTIMALFWVGIGPPWEAVPAVNLMRYLVLLSAAVAITAGFVVLKEALLEAGERLYSALGFGASMMAGATYIVWLSFIIGGYSTKIRSGEGLSTVTSLNDALDTLLFAACFLTYLATAAFAVSFGKARWIGRPASLAFVLLNLIGFLMILIRGLTFPDPMADSAPWYTSPGFIAGIPAVPWIMPHLLGAVMMRHAAAEQR